MGLELELFSLKALFLGCLHFLHICDFFNPLLPQGMDVTIQSSLHWVVW